MPLYEYQCLDNHHSFEIRHPITQDPVKECPVCGGEVRRVIHPVGIVFKGSGFYATDSRGKGVSSSTRSGESGESKANSDSKPSDSKASGETVGKSTDAAGGAAAKPNSQSTSSSAPPSDSKAKQA